MKTKMRERKLADRLDAYIDLPPHADKSAGRPPEAPIIDALRLSAARVEPALEFVERLSTTLRQRRITRPPAPHPHVPLSPRLLWAGAAVAVALLLAFVLPPLFGGDHDLPPLPRLVSAAGPGPQPVPQGLLASADLTLTIDLPEAPAEAPVYRATIAPLPATPDEALAWARDFDLPDPQVYRDPREPEAIFVLGSDDRQLTFRQFGPMGDVHYGNDAATAVDGPPLPFDRAAEVALAFLRQHDLLPVAYRVEEPGDFAPRPENPIRFIHIVPELDGHPLMGYRTGAQVAVNPAGEVTYASFTLISFERGETYPVKSAQEAYDELTGGRVAGSPFRLDTDIRYSAEMDVQHYSPPPPVWSIGQPVTLTGRVHVLVAEPVLSAAEGEGSDIRAQLTAWGGTQYNLTGPRVAELTDVGFEDVQIQGTVVAQVEPEHWQVEVADWETVPQRQPQCLAGTFTPEGGDAWLVTDEGEHYRLPNPPAELSDGQRIEVCADERPADGGDVDWWSIVSPPMSEGEGYVGSISSSVSVVVEAPVEEPLPPTQAETIFEIGQSVEVTGVVRATIFVSGESRRVEAVLKVDEPGGELPPYPLSGPPDVLEAIAQLDRLHVRVRGHVVASAYGPDVMGVEVESFEKVRPDERVQGFLGHLDLETLEGREVAVFTDNETDQRYVLASSLETEGGGLIPRSSMNHEQVFVAGVVQREETYAGMPVLGMMKMHQGSQTATATSADEIPLDIPQVVDESRSLFGPGELQGAFVVDRVELAYYDEPQSPSPVVSSDRAPTWDHPTEQTVQPVWVFYGHNADDTARFTAYVQAVADEYVEKTKATVMPAVPGESGVEVVELSALAGIGLNPSEASPAPSLVGFRTFRVESGVVITAPYHYVNRSNQTEVHRLFVLLDERQQRGAIGNDPDVPYCDVAVRAGERITLTVHIPPLEPGAHDLVVFNILNPDDAPQLEYSRYSLLVGDSDLPVPRDYVTLTDARLPVDQMSLFVTDGPLRDPLLNLRQGSWSSTLSMPVTRPSSMGTQGKSWGLICTALPFWPFWITNRYRSGRAGRGFSTAQCPKALSDTFRPVSGLRRKPDHTIC